MRTDLSKFYNQTDTPVDPQSTDFADVLHYLAGHGLTFPEVISDEVGTPTGIRYTDIELVYTDAVRPPLKLQAFLVMNAPQRAVTDYDLWRGEQKPRIPDEYTPPVRTEPTPVPPSPIVLVGPLMFGKIYYPVAHDDSPDGEKYTDSRGTFVKHKVPSPFGFSVYWEKNS